MKRLLIILVAALSLTLWTAAAGADGSDGGSGGSDGGSGVPVAGTVVSTDAAAGTFVADAYTVTSQGDEFGGDWQAGGSTPVSTRVTITTDANTELRVNDETGTVGDMTVGDKFMALFSGSPGDSIDTVVANPALAVFDQTAPTPRQLYAFVGTVTGTDTTAGTVTVDVTRSLPSDLVPAGSAPVAFTVGPDTLVLGGSSAGDLFGGSLSNVSVGDIVAGGVLADAGQTLTQIESTPLKVLLDLPAATTSGTGPQTSALHRALALLGANGAVKSHKIHKTHKTHKSHTRSHHRGHRGSRSHKHARRA